MQFLTVSNNSPVDFRGYNAVATLFFVFILVINQLDAQNLFYNKFIS